MLVQWANRIGQPLYQCEPPTGYSDKADAWVNTGALLNRMNFSLALTSNRLRGAQVNIETLLGDRAATDPHATLDRAIKALLGGQVSQQTRETLEMQLADPQILQASLDDPVKKVNAAMIAGLVLGLAAAVFGIRRIRRRPGAGVRRLCRGVRSRLERAANATSSGVTCAPPRAAASIAARTPSARCTAERSPLTCTRSPSSRRTTGISASSALRF